MLSRATVKNGDLKHSVRANAPYNYVVPHCHTFVYTRFTFWAQRTVHKMDTTASSQCLSFVKYCLSKSSAYCYICLIVCAISSSLPSVLSSEMNNVSITLPASKAATSIHASILVEADSTTIAAKRTARSTIMTNTTMTVQPLSLSLTDPPLAAQILNASMQQLSGGPSTTATVPLSVLQPPLQRLDFVATQVVDAEPIQGWRCYCWNSTNGSEGELECRCEGHALLRIPQQLHVGMQKLTISQAGLIMLRSIGLRVYSSSLQDIMLTDLLDFENIESGALITLHHLRTIYISNAPKLTHLAAEVFQGISHTFRSLRILNCGLLRIPDMRYLSSAVILYMVDLEGNRITVIDEKSVKIKSEQLILDHNQLTYVNNSAFHGSEIAKLSFKGNTNLKEVHKSAFDGIVNIQELDLSSTSLEVLPTIGLNSLEILRIQNTHSLRTIPSVYLFKNLRIAWLTHSFHCCAFQFPSRHDPYQHNERLKYLDELKRSCISSGFISAKEANAAVDNAQATAGAGIGDDGEWQTSHQEVVDENRELFVAGVEAEILAGFERNHTTRRRRNLTARWHNKSGRGEFQNHFEDEELRRFNKTRYSMDSDSEDFIHPITGAPFSGQEGAAGSFDSSVSDGSSSELFGQNLDFGEFHETTADVHPNSLLNATCGNLSKNKIMLRCFPVPDALNPCEDVMGSQWLRTSVWIVVFLAVFGNIAVLVVLFSNWKDVTVSKFLMSNLAFADLSLGLYLLLIAAIDIHSMGEYFNFGYDWQYGSGCKAAGFLTVFASHLSVFTLTIITLERWYAITHAINLNKRINLRSATFIMAGGWSYSIVMSSLPLFGVSNYSSTSICLPMEARDSLDVAYLVLIIAISGFAFFFIAICYAQIYFSLGKETRQAARHASRGEMTIAKKMALLVFTNFACWAPIAFFGLTAIAGLPFIDVAKSKILLVFFYPLNSCADPYLYAILTAQYRRDLFILLSKLGFCKKRAQKYKMNYSLPMTNQTTYPIPLIERPSISERGMRKISQDFNQKEDYV